MSRTKAVWVPKPRRNSKGSLTPLTPEQVAARDAARAARTAEKTRRSMESRRRAWNLLAQAHPTEFADLLADMTEQVDDERGPLPEVPEP